MSSNNYQIYINQTLQLAETIVIKSSYTAQALNEWVQAASAASGYLTPVDPDPTTWKYYRNLAGEYHPVDQVMKVVSMDTLDEIIFNKYNLVIHTATQRAYQYGTRQYADLVARYPEQEQLILGILYPIDIDTAIAGRDGQILGYPPGLVEDTEYSLIDRLQKWIYHYKQRWHIPGFDYVDELYNATMLGQMYALLVQAILTYRVAACNTNEAHSFHIREYLAGHGYLDAYVSSMTRKQALYFYRNIAYIEHHAGRNSTFDTLTEHIMSERRLPIAEYSMKHDVAEQTTNLYPEVIFRKRQLNLGITLPPDNETTIAQMLTKELPIANGNGEDLDDTVTDIQHLMQNSPSNVVATKVLESSMVDEANSSPWILSEILFNHWIHLSVNERYTAYVNLAHPKTGEIIPLTAKEAFILALYVFAKSINGNLVTIPPAYASRVQRLPTATIDDIYSIVDHQLIERDVAVTALALQPNIGALISIDAFYNLNVRINDAVQMQRRLISSQQHYERRAMVQAMVTRIYSDYVIDLEPPGTLYSDWLTHRNIDLSQFTREDFVNFYGTIVGQATGANLHQEETLAQLQRAMVGMFRQLSSYGIQILAEINDGNIRKTDRPAVRLGSVTSDLAAHVRSSDATIGIDSITESMDIGVTIDLNHPGVDPDVHQYGKHRVTVDLAFTNGFMRHPTNYRYEAPLSNLKVSSSADEVAVPRGWIPFIGIEYFLNLDPEQIILIGNGTYNPPSGYKPTKIPLSQVVTITELLPFDYSASYEPLGNSITNVLLGKTYPEN